MKMQEKFEWGGGGCKVVAGGCSVSAQVLTRSLKHASTIFKKEIKKCDLEWQRCASAEPERYVI